MHGQVEQLKDVPKFLVRQDGVGGSRFMRVVLVMLGGDLSNDIHLFVLALEGEVQYSASDNSSHNKDGIGNHGRQVSRTGRLIVEVRRVDLSNVADGVGNGESSRTFFNRAGDLHRLV